MMASPLQDHTIAVIGGTGKTGKWAIKGALQRGANVKVLCRTPDKVRSVYATLWKDGHPPDSLSYDNVLESGKLVVVKGSLPIGDSSNGPTEEQMSALKALVRGSTHLMSFLGMDPKNMQPVCGPGIQAIMKATSECDDTGATKPKIFIMSSIILSDSYEQGKAAWGCCGCVGKFMRWKFLKGCFDDMEAAEQYAFDNRTKMGLDVTLLRATVLADKKNYYLDFSATENKKYYMVTSDELKRVKMQIDRQHVVQCFMDAAEDGEGKLGANSEWSLFGA